MEKDLHAKRAEAKKEKQEKEELLNERTALL